MLDTAVRKVDRVGALPGSSAIVSLRSIKASSRVVVGHSVLVGVGGNLVRVNLSHSMTHNSMADTMADTNAMANTNAMADTNTMADTMTNTNAVADTNTMADANAMANSNAMSNPSKELGGGRCSCCQG